MLRPLSQIFNPDDYPALMVGLAAPDDAAVYRLADGQAIISTVDFFPPVVDDPYHFGAIAAANALSDVYAMGGEVLFAINLAAFPDTLELEILSEILRGGAERVKAAGAVIAGGHTIKDKEPKYGLAVTGIVNAERIITKGGAKPGDVLILTKALGTGVITTALKRGVSEQAHVETAIQTMISLNREGSQAAQAVGVHAMTDITGYSLIGHAHEMAHLSGVDVRLNFESLPFLPGALDYAKANTFPGGATANWEFYRPWFILDRPLSEELQLLLCDPQTSGGLLMSLPEAKTEALLQALHQRGVKGWVVGQVIAGEGRVRLY